MPYMAVLGSGKGLVVNVAICMKPYTPWRRAETRVNKYEKFTPLVRNMLDLAHAKASVSHWEPDGNGAKTTPMY